MTPAEALQWIVIGAAAILLTLLIAWWPQRHIK